MDREGAKHTARQDHGSVRLWQRVPSPARRPDHIKRRSSTAGDIDLGSISQDADRQLDWTRRL